MALATVVPPTDAVQPVRVKIHASQVNVPIRCVCCGENLPEPDVGVTLTRGVKSLCYDVRMLQFPYCAACVQHIKVAQSAHVVTRLTIVVGLLCLLATSVVFFFNPVIGLEATFIASLFLLVGVYIRRVKMKKSQTTARGRCCTIGEAATHTEWYRTIHTFQFYNRQYADAFTEANRENVVA
jgi:hypothetical protein